MPARRRRDAVEVRRCRSTAASLRTGSPSSLSSRCRAGGPRAAVGVCQQPLGFGTSSPGRGEEEQEEHSRVSAVCFLHPSPRAILFAPLLILHAPEDARAGRQRRCIGGGSFAPATRSTQCWGMPRLDGFLCVKVHFEVHFRAASQWKDLLRLRSARCPG